MMGRVRTLLVGGGIRLASGVSCIVMREGCEDAWFVVGLVRWVLWVEGWVWYRDVCLVCEVRSPRVGLGRYDDR